MFQCRPRSMTSRFRDPRRPKIQKFCSRVKPDENAKVLQALTKARLRTPFLQRVWRRHPASRVPRISGLRTPFLQRVWRLLLHDINGFRQVTDAFPAEGMETFLFTETSFCPLLRTPFLQRVWRPPKLRTDTLEAVTDAFPAEGMETFQDHGFTVLMDVTDAFPAEGMETGFFERRPCTIQKLRTPFRQRVWRQTVGNNGLLIFHVTDAFATEGMETGSSVRHLECIGRVTVTFAAEDMETHFRMYQAPKRVTDAFAVEGMETNPTCRVRPAARLRTPLLRRVWKRSSRVI